MQDDFLTALTYSIKEEIVENYFHSRQVVEEEQAETAQMKAELAEKGELVGRRLSRLTKLLLDPWSVARFWELLDLDPPADVDPDQYEHAFQSLGGLTWKSRYRRLVRQAARDLAEAAEEHQHALELFREQIEEVNADIDKFNANHDFLLIKSVLGQMDPETVEKKYFMGCSLEGQACLDLDEALKFNKDNPAWDKLRALPPLPPMDEVERAADQVAHDAIHRHPHLIHDLLDRDTE